jgi:hypothetical protein
MNCSNRLYIVGIVIIALLLTNVFFYMTTRSVLPSEPVVEKFEQPEEIETFIDKDKIKGVFFSELKNISSKLTTLVNAVDRSLEKATAGDVTVPDVTAEDSGSDSDSDSDDGNNGGVEGFKPYDMFA